MKGVATIGKKGGNGKTTLAHLLALGACWKAVPAHFMHTDDREPIQVEGRPYMYYDAREPENLTTFINMAVNSDGLFVLDGGGNRPEFDIWAAEHMDLVLLPVTPDPEDVDVSIAHMEQLQKNGADNVWFVLNKIPANLHDKRYIRRYLDNLPTNRILTALPEMKAVRVLREHDVEPFETPPSKVNNMARVFFSKVNHRLKLIDQASQSRKAA